MGDPGVGVVVDWSVPQEEQGGRQGGGEGEIRGVSKRWSRRRCDQDKTVVLPDPMRSNEKRKAEGKKERETSTNRRPGSAGS